MSNQFRHEIDLHLVKLQLIFSFCVFTNHVSLELCTNLVEVFKPCLLTNLEIIILSINQMFSQINNIPKYFLRVIENFTLHELSDFVNRFHQVFQVINFLLKYPSVNLKIRDKFVDLLISLTMQASASFNHKLTSFRYKS